LGRRASCWGSPRDGCGAGAPAPSRAGGLAAGSGRLQRRVQSARPHQPGERRRAKIICSGAFECATHDSVEGGAWLDQTAYLQAHFVDTEEAPILSGDVALHRDGAFVGQSNIAFVAPGDGLDLGFGADDKIKIQRAPVNRKENEPTWYNQSKIETREFKTTVKNLHDFPVKVQVIDRLPISENTAITVEMLPTTTAPTEKQVGDKRGVMSWTLDLAPNEAKDIRLAYRMKWPADRDVALGGAPISAQGE
jgi:Domain of unknown function (DUF4139)